MYDNNCRVVTTLYVFFKSVRTRRNFGYLRVKNDKQLLSNGRDDFWRESAAERQFDEQQVGF